MSWQDRQYASPYDDTYSSGGGGLQSWLGGLPPLSKVVKWILIANAALFVLVLVTGGQDSFIYRWLAMNTALVKKGQIWRLFTFTYLHDPRTIGHIFFNMLGLYFLGVPLESHYGAKRFFVFYTIAGFASVLLYLIVTLSGWLSPYAMLVGASGGVLATMGACAVLFPQMRLILFLFPVPIRAVALLAVGLYTFNLFTRGHNAGGDACHLAGLAFGIAWGYRSQHFWYWWESRGARKKAGAWERQRREAAERQNQVDAILDKVKQHGINSLTRREKQLLEDASRRQAVQDRRHGL